MSLPVRTKLVPLGDDVLSSYPIGKKRAELLPVSKLGGSAHLMPKDARDALEALHGAIYQVKGDLRITECRRDTAVQAAARAKYVQWLKDGKPSPHNPKIHKPHFVSKPGYSWHNAGRAIDVHVREKDMGVLFRTAPVDKQLDLFWPIAKRAGWRPVIKAPDEYASEAWHFDYMGEWAPVYDRLGYEQAAMAACLDVGVAIYGRDAGRLVQAQLHRAGYDVGEIDGYTGEKTKAGIKAAGLSPKKVLADPSLLFDLPSSTTLVWEG